MEKKDGKIHTRRALSNLHRLKNKMATKYFGLTLTDKKIHIKFNGLIETQLKTNNLFFSI